jgi:Na+/H+-translocating membrane pyrophosphatase
MDNTTTLSKNSVAYGLALAVTCVINALIVVVKEKSESVMAGMKSITGHHWTTHAAAVVLLFVALGWFFGRANGGQGKIATISSLIRTLVSGVVLGTLIIVGFYLFID